MDSFNFNAHKWLLTNADCSAMWFRNTNDAEEAFKVKTSISEAHDVFEPEVQHWQIPSCRRFRALKLWLVMRIYGIEGFQKHIRHQVSLAKYFEQLVRTDDRFELILSSMGVVCFRLNGDDCLTHNILDKITERKNLFMMPYYYQGRLVARFVICSRLTEREDIHFAWNEILNITEEVLNKKKDSSDQKNTSKIVNKTSLSPKISVGILL